jgi:apolipoprotein D and lipocalin family protein
MTAQTLPGRSLPEAGDLDTRILLVEQRLIAREEALRVDIETVGQRVRQKLHVGRRALPAIGLSVTAAAVGAVVWWKWSHPSRPAASPQARGSSPDSGRPAELPWVRLVALAWPMLPAAWRSRVSPATASTLAALGLPLIERMLHGRPPAPLVTMPSVDLTRFAGRWFVLARLPARVGSAVGTLSYLPRPDGDFDAVSTSPTEPAEPPVHGIAQVEPGSAGARLRVSQWPRWLRFLPLAWTEHAIVHVDEAYGEALVGSSDRDHLWLLARQPQLAPQRRHALLQLARERGFAVERLMTGFDGA